jgi:hypothetical protein
MNPCHAFQQALIESRVAARFIQSDDRFRPPKYILNGVETQELPDKVLMIWKYCVEKMGDKFDFGGATVYWRNKCAKEGIVLPPQYLQKETGATWGNFKIMGGDQIEQWVKERLKSSGLLDESRRTVQEWELEIAHLRRVVEEAQQKVDKHTKGIAEGSRVKQRQGWLAEAQQSLDGATRDLDKAEKAVQDLGRAQERHVDAQAPVISFEQQFQVLLNQALNDMSRKEVLARAKQALAAFEQQISQAGQARMAGRQAGLQDLVERLWDRVKGSFAAIKDWTLDILHSAKQLNRLFDSV